MQVEFSHMNAQFPATLKVKPLNTEGLNLETFLYIAQFLGDAMTSGPIYDWLNELLHSEVTKMTVAFLIASQVHARKVQKEFRLLRESVDHLGAALLTFNTRFEELEKRVSHLEEKDETQ